MTTGSDDDRDREIALAQTMTSVAVLVIAAALVVGGGVAGALVGLRDRGGPSLWASGTPQMAGMPMMPGMPGMSGMGSMMGGTAGTSSPAAPSTPSPSPAAPAFSLESVSAELADHYRFAADHPAPYRHVPCFCGCQAMLGHKSLFDCFVRPDGAWEVHASGCAVCMDESIQLRTLLARGASVDRIHDAIVARYGGLASPPAT
jgi:hypothetical protein